MLCQSKRSHVIPAMAAACPARRTSAAVLFSSGQLSGAVLSLMRDASVVAFLCVEQTGSCGAMLMNRYTELECVTR